MVFRDGIWSTSAALVCATSAAVAAAGLAYKKTKKSEQNGSSSSSSNSHEPTRWMKVGTVSQLIIYPVKGCAGVRVSQAKATQLGLKDGEFLRDRVFMIVDESGAYQVQMKHPKLALVSVKAHDNDGSITLKAPDMPTLTFHVPDGKPEDNELACRIFQEKGLKAVDCGTEAAKWFQTFLQQDGMRLVYHHLNKSQRQISGLQLQFPSVQPTDLATFQNYTSFLLITEESIDELNKHVEKKVSYRNFRPSILVSGVQEPFAEIRWGYVKIGDVELRASKPCERCKITTVDPDTGINDPDGEPLKTLAKLQMEFGDEICKNVLKNRGIMGLQMGLSRTTTTADDGEGGAVIKVGDSVHVALL